MRLADQSWRILLAEDDAISQRVVRLILKHAGFTVDVVGNGSEALEVHGSNPYDLILMDCQMPEMDGLEATRRIRQLDHPQPVIIAITVNVFPGEREKCLSAGMDDYLAKPFRAEQLVSIIRKGTDKAAVRCGVLLGPAQELCSA